jgi:3-methyladenine DNA glycosylase AlkD
MESVIPELRSNLKDNVDEHTKSTSQRFFKEKVNAYGVKTSTVTKIAKQFYENIQPISKDKVFQLCEELFSSGMLEESFIACKWSEYINNYEETDFQIFEHWINSYINNWATCDTFCNHTVGAFIVKYPSYITRLFDWACSDNMWMRRASAVSLIIPAKRGLFLREAFKISDLLTGDGEDLVQRGFGWLLKEESRTHQAEVYDYILRKRDVMPRTALRYAIKLMPDEMRQEAMKKW